MVPLYLALVHYPVLNRKGEIIASAFTNLDLHDMARAARTYEIPACYIVTPLQDQQVLIKRLLDHWCEGVGKELHPDREEALKRLKIADDIAAVKEDIRAECGESPLVWATTAREPSGSPDPPASQAATGERTVGHISCFLVPVGVWRPPL